MVTKALSQFVAEMTPQQLPTPVIAMAKRTVLDWLASAYVGSREPAARYVTNVVRQQGGCPEATVIGMAERSSSLNASLANGTMSHTVELDDLHKESIVHPAAPIIPAALAIAEREHKTGTEFLTAVIVGYDVCLRIGEAVSPSHYKKFHATGTCGTFGAAAASSYLLGLDSEQVTYALGNAGTQAAALWQYLKDGDMSKSLHPGKAAMEGVLAALLAREGFTGAREIIEGERGFAATMAEEFRSEIVTDKLGDHYKILENGFKIHACCRHTHSAIDIAIQLATEHDLNPRNIAQITVYTNPMTIQVTGDYDPPSIYKAKFSMAFVVGVALAYRQAGLDEFLPQRLHDPIVQGLMKKTRLVADPEYAASFPEKWSARIELKTLDGRSYSGQTDFPKGDSDNPVSDEEIREKFSQMVSPLLPPEQVSYLITATDQLQDLTDISEFLPPHIAIQDDQFEQTRP